MAQLRLLDGKLIKCDNKLAVSDACCGGECPCALEEVSCPHAFCFSFNLASQDLQDGYYDGGYLLRPRFSGNPAGMDAVAWIESDGGGGYLAGFACGGASVHVAMTLEEFFDNWHHVTITYDGDSETIEVCAYGETGSGTNSISTVDEVFVGSDQAFPGPVSLQIKDIKMLSNPDSSEEDFVFPDTPFDAAEGAGQSTAGDTVQVICSDGGANGYTKAFTPVWKMICGVPCDAPQIYCSGVTVTLNKCGWAFPGTSPSKVYKNASASMSWTASCHTPETCGPGETECTHSYTDDASWTATLVCDGTCTKSMTRFWTNTMCGESDTGSTPEADPLSWVQDLDCDQRVCAGFCGYLSEQDYNESDPTISSTFVADDAAGCDGGAPDTGSGTNSVTFSNEFTSEELLAKCLSCLDEADFPEFSFCLGIDVGGLGLIADETTGSATKTNWKFHFGLTLPCDVHLTWQERFQPQDEETFTYSPIFAEIILAGATEGVVHTTSPPDELGSISIVNVTCHEYCPEE